MIAFISPVKKLENLVQGSWDLVHCRCLSSFGGREAGGKKKDLKEGN